MLQRSININILKRPIFWNKECFRSVVYGRITKNVQILPTIIEKVETVSIAEGAFLSDDQNPDQ